MRAVRVTVFRFILVSLSFVVAAPAMAQNALITWNVNAADAILAGRTPASSAVLMAITQWLPSKADSCRMRLM